VTSPPRRIIVTDATVLINLAHVNRLEMLGAVPGYEFVVPDHVRDEITDTGQRALLDDAVRRGIFRVEAITSIASIALYAALTARLGRGEAACLTLAVERDWIVASDDRKRFRREAESRIGPGRIVGLKELYLLAIGAGLLDIDEADADKATLETRRFVMDFKSFRDLVT
jgi:predicted nucleic acid-binding protein